MLLSSELLRAFFFFSQVCLYCDSPWDLVGQGLLHVLELLVQAVVIRQPPVGGRGRVGVRVGLGLGLGLRIWLG